jgi:integrase
VLKGLRIYNDYIKLVCEEAKIDELIKGKIQENIASENEPSKIRSVEGIYKKYELVTSHIGRRSFATNHYGKIPTSFLKYVTGHSTESMFLEYIGKSNKDIALELSKYLG